MRLRSRLSSGKKKLHLHVLSEEMTHLERDEGDAVRVRFYRDLNALVLSPAGIVDSANECYMLKAEGNAFCYAAVQLWVSRYPELYDAEGGPAVSFETELLERAGLPIVVGHLDRRIETSLRRGRPSPRAIDYEV